MNTRSEISQDEAVAPHEAWIDGRFQGAAD